MTSVWENAVITAYRLHLVVALPLTILAIKVLVRVVAREPKKEVFRSVLVLPLDFVYIAMGILLAAAARRDAALMKHYESDASADMAVVLQMISLMISATVITIFDRWVRVLYQKFYAAWQLLGQKMKEAKLAGGQTPQGSDGQMNLNLASADGATFSGESGILLAWIMFYWTAMAPLWMGQAALGLLCLGSILSRLK
jgi:hypothetical protein